jgi:hypothetical protein
MMTLPRWRVHSRPGGKGESLGPPGSGRGGGRCGASGRGAGDTVHGAWRAGEGSSRCARRCRARRRRRRWPLYRRIVGHSGNRSVSNGRSCRVPRHQPSVRRRHEYWRCRLRSASGPCRHGDRGRSVRTGAARVGAAAQVDFQVIDEELTMPVLRIASAGTEETE